MDDKKDRIAAYMSGLYKEWQYRQPAGKGDSQAKWSKWMGILPTTMSNIVNGIRLPSVASADKIAAKYGPKIYDMMEIPRRMPDDKVAEFIMSNWHELTDADVEAIKSIVDMRREEINQTA